MSESETVASARTYPYDPTIYRGTAAHYRSGRSPYSGELEAIFTEKLGLDGKGRLLDVGCGPGILTLRLAGLFEEVVGVEPDADMLAEAASDAAAAGVTNAKWFQGVAEDLPGIAPGPYRLVTFGQSFHWTKGAPVAEEIFDLLEPGGAMAILSHTIAGRPQPPNPGYPLIPHREIVALVEKYLGTTNKRALQRFGPAHSHGFEEVLEKTRFGRPEQFFAPGRADFVRDVDSVLSLYFAMSTSAPRLFGDRLDDFSNDMRQLLLEQSPTGLFWDWPGDTEVLLSRKP